MERSTGNIPSNPNLYIQLPYVVSENPPVPVYLVHGGVLQPQHPQLSNQIIPFHLRTHFTPEAILDRGNLVAVSSNTTRFPLDRCPQQRSAHEIFHRTGLADPIPDVPNLSSLGFMPPPSTWTSPAMKASNQQNSEQNAGFGHSHSNPQTGGGQYIPSGRLTCRSWFTKGECDKPPGQCRYMHTHNGQGVPTLPAIEVDSQPIEKEILCRTDFLPPLPNVRHYESHSPELKDPDTQSAGPLVVGPRSSSQPYEMRAKIYSIVALSNRLQRMVQKPQTPGSNGSGTHQNGATSSLSVELAKARDFVQELYTEFQTYHTVIEQIQPRLLDFAEPLRNAAHAMNMTYRELSLLELMKMAADEIRVIIGRHRVAEWLTIDGKKSLKPL